MSWSDTSISVLIPPNLAAQAQPVLVHASGVDSNTGTFTVNSAMSSGPGGTISTVAGDGTNIDYFAYANKQQNANGDGGPATSANVSANASIGVDSVGNLYLANYGTANNTYHYAYRREVDGNTGIIKMLGTIEYVQGSIPTATWDRQGNLYYAYEQQTTTTQTVIYKQAASGQVTPLVSIPSNGGSVSNLSSDANGSIYFIDRYRAVLAKFIASTGQQLGCMPTIAADLSMSCNWQDLSTLPQQNVTLYGLGDVFASPSGDIYMYNFWIHDTNYHASSGNLFKIAASSSTIQPLGTVNLNTGTKTSYCYAADRTNPYVIFNNEIADDSGHIYFLDAGNQQIKRVNLPNLTDVAVVAGTGSAGFSGDGGPATNATFCRITAMTLDAAGDLYIADEGNYRVRRVGRPSKTPNVNWSTPLPIGITTPLSAVQLNASATYNGSAVDGTYTYAPAAGSLLSAGTHTLFVTFTPTDTNAYNPATATVTIVVNNLASPVITWPAPDAITYGTAFVGAASANVAGSFIYSPATGTVLDAGVHALWLTFVPNDTADYNPVNAANTLVVNKAIPTVVWPPPQPITSRTPLSSAQLNATANVA
jgi:hypothetical protein